MSVSLTGLEISKIFVSELGDIRYGSLLKKKPNPYVVIQIDDAKVGKTKSCSKKNGFLYKDIIFTEVGETFKNLRLSVYHKTMNFLFGNDQFLGCVTIPLDSFVKNEEKNFELNLKRSEMGKISFCVKSYNFGVIRKDPVEETEGEVEVVEEKKPEDQKKEENKEKKVSEKIRIESTEESKTDNLKTPSSDSPLWNVSMESPNTNVQYVDSQEFSKRSFISSELSFETASLQGEMDKKFFSAMNSYEETKQGDVDEESSKESKYSLVRKIGGGGMGHVFVAVEKQDNSPIKREIAIKKVKCKSLKKVNDSMAEIWPTRKLDHPNLCIVQDMFFNSSKEKDQPFVLNLVMEYYTEGDLNSYIKKVRKSNTPKIPNETIISFMTQLADGLKYVHDNNILHRDVKPENIFLDKNYTKVLIGDFGLAKKLSSSRLAVTSCGTPYYMAPEVLSSRGYNAKADIWSLGCVFYKLCALELKRIFNFEVYSNPNFYKSIRTAIIEDRGYPISFADLICEMLDKEPHERPTATKLLEKFKLLKNKKNEEVNGEESKEKEKDCKESVGKEDFSGVKWLDLLKRQDWEKLKRCLESIEDIQSVNTLIDFENENVLMTPLIYAQKYNRREIMKLLLKKGQADPNEADNDGFTPLIRAVLWDQKEIIKLLLRFGAIPRMRSREGITTFDYIERHNKQYLMVLFED